MSDFYYKYKGKGIEIPKFNDIYSLKIAIKHDFVIYYNEKTIMHFEEGGDSITILGYVFTLKDEISKYAIDILTHFDEHNIPELKKNLLGQYTVIIVKRNMIYLFSDFLQTRNIFYNIENQSVSSSFLVVRETESNKINENYKAFEYLAMRHCLYPVWIGEETIDHRIKRLCAYQYLKINTETGAIEKEELQYEINNAKITSLKEIQQYTLLTLRKAIQHSTYQNANIDATITGGFDSRLITSLVKEYYPNTNLRIATWRSTDSLDYQIATKVAKALSSPLKVYKTDPEMQKKYFYRITDGLSPKENAVMTQLFLHTNECTLGFGGAFGTELYLSSSYNNSDELITDYVQKAQLYVKANNDYYKRFRHTLHKEFENIHQHYIFKEKNLKDDIRIFQLLITGSFSAPFISAFNIHGKQFEVFGAYPVIEAGLRIPYIFLGGGKWTFGRFYMIPKRIMESINKKVSRIDTTHFCPMRPLSIYTIVPYVLGRKRSKKYYEKLVKTQADIPSINLDTENFHYTSNEWFEGFKQTYF